MISLFEAMEVGAERVLIKLATTWEGIQAAKTLEYILIIHIDYILI